MKEQIEARIVALANKVLGYEAWLPITTPEGERLYKALIRCHVEEVDFLRKLLLSLETEKMAENEPKS